MRLNYFGIVEHQQVAWYRQLGQVGKAAVYRQGAAAIKQARTAALGRWLLGE